MTRLHADVLWAGVILTLILVLVLLSMSTPAVVPAEVRDHWPTVVRTTDGEVVGVMPEDICREAGSPGC